MTANMTETKAVVDIDLFKNLDHIKLAEHVFPGTFNGRGKDRYAARNDAMQEVIEAFASNFQLKLRLAPKDWIPTGVAGPTGIIKNTKQLYIRVPRCNINKKNHCILYCSECIEEHDYLCTPVAKITFGASSPDATTGVVSTESKVEWMFFHDCHNCRQRTETLMQSGYCVIPTPCEFMTRGIYNNAIAEGRKLLHDEKGVVKGSKLGLKIKETDEEEKKEYAFNYITGELDNNRAYMMASNESTKNWQKKEYRASWAERVNAAEHVSNMVRLYYCISNLFGLSSLAAPFTYKLDSTYKVSGSTPNHSHKMFFQEESVIVGGFRYTKELEHQQLHIDYNRGKLFQTSYPHPSIKSVAELIKYGFSVISSLLEDEERDIYISHVDNKITIPFNMSLVFLGNLPHGGVTRTIKKGDKKIWPALHIHVDLQSKKRLPGVLGIPDEDMQNKSRKRT